LGRYLFPIHQASLHLTRIEGEIIFSGSISGGGIVIKPGCPLRYFIFDLDREIVGGALPLAECAV
jgi:hypothetical protein